MKPGFDSTGSNSATGSLLIFCAGRQNSSPPPACNRPDGRIRRDATVGYMSTEPEDQCTPVSTTPPVPTVRGPRLLIFDVNETLSDMAPMAGRFEDVGAPATW